MSILTEMVLTSLGEFSTHSIRHLKIFHTGAFLCVSQGTSLEADASPRLGVRDGVLI